MMLKTAIEWLNLGIATIPIIKGTKRPAVRWKQYQTELPTLPQLIQWHKDNQYNLAVICGPVSNDLVIVDFDHIVEYSKFRCKYPELVDTYTIQSARGMHLYYFCSNPPNQSALGDNVDIKSTGYVLCPPSVHPSGKAYRIVNDKPIMEVDSLHVIAQSSKVFNGCQSHIQINITGDNNTLHLNTLETLRYDHGLIYAVKAGISLLQYLQNQSPVQSSQDGRFYMALCPAHNDTARSLSIDTQGGLVSCFRSDCPLHSKRGYDVVGVHAKLNGLSNGLAAKQLAERLGL